MPALYREVNIIPSETWVHTPTGRRASPYGAAPWTSAEDKPNWELVSVGWTWECIGHDGSVTIGACRRPAKTRDEAEKVARKLVGID